MHCKRIDHNPKTFALIMDTGDEVVEILKKFASSQQLSGSSFKAIGALSYVQLGWFNWETRKYEVAAEFSDQVELLSLIGDIASQDGQPQVHAHLVVSRRDGTAHGGHLLKACVRPTCELILTESPEHLQKRIDPQSGLALIRF
jgi:uncharacterized protein